MIGQIAFIEPTPEQLRQAVLSTLLTQKYLTVILVAFLLPLGILSLVRVIKSFLIKILIGLIVAAAVAAFLYLRISSQIEF